MKKKASLFLGGVASAATYLTIAGNTWAIEVGEVTKSKGFASDLGGVISSVLTVVLAIAALAVFMYLIWGGIQWITSGGDKGKTEEARNKITAAVIGLIVLAASYAILQIGLRLLGFNNLTETFTNVKPIGTEEQTGA